MSDLDDIEDIFEVSARVWKCLFRQLCQIHSCSIVVTVYTECDVTFRLPTHEIDISLIINYLG